MDSSEVGHPPSKFQNVFTAAQQAGSLTVTYTDEEGPSEYVYEALNLPKISRIGHGVHPEEDAALMRWLIREKIPLTMCSLNSLKLEIVGNFSEYNSRRMLQDGVLVTVSPDDPVYFGGYVNQNFTELAAALDLTENDVRTLCKNSFAVLFLSSEEKAA